MRDVLVDTDILINFLRGREKAKDFLFSILEDSTIYYLQAHKSQAFPERCKPNLKRGQLSRKIF